MHRQLAAGVLLAAGALCAGVPARADGDLVFSGRYYTSPNVHATSHFHLYRINPDGSGLMQLTRGDASPPEAPQWLPGAKQILFFRDEGEGSLAREAGPEPYVVEARGGKPLKVTDLGYPRGLRYEWSPDGRWVLVGRGRLKRSTGVAFRFLLVDVATKRRRSLGTASAVAWSPDGRRLYVARPSGKNAIVAVAGGEAVRVTDPVQIAAWLDRETIVGVPHVAGEIPLFDEKQPGSLRIIGLDGKQQRHVQLAWADGAPPEPDVGGRDLTQGFLEALLRVPNDPNILVMQIVHPNSTASVWRYVSVDRRTGIVRLLTDGAQFKLSPDGHSFCIAPSRYLVPYGRPRGDGAQRTVWVSPLLVGRLRDGAPRRIVPELVETEGCDWRKPGQRR